MRRRRVSGIVALAVLLGAMLGCSGFRQDVIVTLYVHDGSAGGPVLSGVSVTGWDGVGTSFNQTTNASGYVTLTGRPGTWHFSASKPGYYASAWEEYTPSDVTRSTWLTPGVFAPVTLTLYVHDGSASGPVLPGVSVTGWDGVGTTFSQTTNASGYVTLTGRPGTWHFSAVKAGYLGQIWEQSTAEDATLHVYLAPPLRHL